MQKSQPWKAGSKKTKVRVFPTRKRTKTEILLNTGGRRVDLTRTGGLNYKNAMVDLWNRL